MPVPPETPAAGKAGADALAADLRAETNRLTDVKREKAGKEFLKLFYGSVREPAETRRR